MSTSEVIDAVSRIGSFIVLAAGFGLNWWVQRRNGKTMTAVKAITEKSAEVLAQVENKTDGRLTEVIEKTAVLEAQAIAQTTIIVELREQLTTERAEKAKSAADLEADKRAEARIEQRKRTSGEKASP